MSAAEPTPPAAGFRAGPTDDPDRYQLGAAASAGSEGVVYRGSLDVDGHQVPVAVKMLHPSHHAALDRWVDLWQEQAGLLRSVVAPGLVAVRDVFAGPLPHPPTKADQATRTVFLVMDWVDGEPLWDWARRQPNATAEQLLVPLVSVAAALDLLHSGTSTAGSGTAGVPLVHGDVKPGNVLLTPDATAVLVDLGSLRSADAASGTGGTPGYLAPEVLRDGTWTPAADRYALGCVAIGLVTGAEVPVGGGLEAFRELLEASPRTRDRADLVDHLLTMVEPDPALRPAGLANWVAQLRRSSLVLTPGETRLPPLAPASLGAPPEPARRSARTRSVLGAAAAVVVLLAGVAAVLADGEDEPGRSSTSSTTSTTRPAMAGGPTLDDFDFASFHYPAGTCGHVDGVDATNGSFLVPDAAEYDGDQPNGTYAFPSLTVTTARSGDLDADGDAEHVVLLTCDAMIGSASRTQLQVYTPNADGTPRLVGAEPPMECFTSVGECGPNHDGATGEVRRFADPTEITDGQIRVRALFTEATDSRCCPSTTAELRYELAPTGLREVGGTILADTDGEGGPVPALLRGLDSGWDVSAIADEATIAAARAFSTNRFEIVPHYPFDGSRSVLVEQISGYREDGDEPKAIRIDFTVDPFRVTRVVSVPVPESFCVTATSPSPLLSAPEPDATELASVPSDRCDVRATAPSELVRHHGSESAWRKVTWDGTTGWISDWDLDASDG